MKLNKEISKWIFVIVAVMIVVVLSILKYKSGEIKFKNQDATWHVLLTMTAYDETPKSIHKFVPIVSLGGEDNKNIPWGVTVPDEEGNYYYTSFSPAGFVLPWLFIKILHLPMAEKSLYLFNTILFAMSVVFWVLLLEKLFQKNQHKNIVVLIGILTYILVPELCHGMGITYWHQSILQVTLCMQLYFYYRYKYENNKTSYILFLGLCFANPYIEWTGFVANVGFAFAEFISNLKASKKDAFKKAIIIGVLTILSFVLFSVHYLLVLSPSAFFGALRDRFFARNFTTKVVMLSEVFGGYINSFLYMWILLFAVSVYLIVTKGKIEFHNKLMMLVMLFPIIENFIMKEHAVSYTYDRMKLIFLLSYLICDLIAQALEDKKSNKLAIAFIVIVMICGMLNVDSYIKDRNNIYFFKTNYKQTNQELANYINEKYPDSVLVTPGFVRGYMNLLFHRGIYEGRLLDSAY